MDEWTDRWINKWNKHMDGHMYIWLEWMAEWKEGNVLFNDTFNTFYLRLHSVRHMVKNHLYSERGNRLPPLHGLLFPISSKGSFICTIPERKAHILAFVTPVMKHWLERENEWKNGWTDGMNEICWQFYTYLIPTRLLVSATLITSCL